MFHIFVPIFGSRGSVFCLFFFTDFHFYLFLSCFQSPSIHVKDFPPFTSEAFSSYSCYL